MSQIWNRVKFNSYHDHEWSEWTIENVHPYNWTYQVRIAKWYHAAGAIVSANDEQLEAIPLHEPTMSHHDYEEAHQEPDYHGEHSSGETHSPLAKKFISFAGIAVIIALVAWFAFQNDLKLGISKHGDAMKKVEDINSKNLELVERREGLRIQRDAAKLQFDTANRDIKTIEETIRKNKAEAASLLKKIYE